MTSCPETIIDLIDDLPTIDQQRLAAALHEGSRFDLPRNWHRVPTIMRTPECDGECESAEALRSNLSSVEYELDDLRDERDRLEDDRDEWKARAEAAEALLAEHGIDLPD